MQDLNLVATQLRAAVSAPDVAFVDVQPAGNTPASSPVTPPTPTGTCAPSSTPTSAPTLARPT
ncbi:hypothetical protein [Deinococcus aquaticus]|uniref:hypothetical protein n=1 Tax=Deinococcus aquaticus TaxID=328692 RepID=UPI00360ABE88